jgi:hypothetical protein
MGYVVKMPKLGIDMDQGTVVEWFVEGTASEQAATTGVSGPSGAPRPANPTRRPGP